MYSTNINVIIVEDDPIFRDMLLDMLPKSTTPTSLLAICTTIRQAKDAIEKFQPKLILLDVELPDGTGVDLLNSYTDNGNFETIFITSHDKYAIDAIKRNAADYIVKPVKQNELNEALLKVHKRIEIYNKLLKHDELFQSVEKLKSQNLQDTKIMINTVDGAMFIKVSEIIMLQSESNYTLIHLENNKKFLASKTLSIFDEMLESLNFMRVHRSFIINLTKIQKIKCTDSNYVAVLENNSTVEISRRKKKDFFEKISYQF